MTNSQTSNDLLRYIQRNHQLTPAEQSAIVNLPHRVLVVRPEEKLVREGEPPEGCLILLEGFLHTFKTLPDGRRQITALHIAGDMPDLQGLYLGRVHFSVAASIQSRVASVNRAHLRQVAREHSGIARALMHQMLVDSEISREWLLVVGARGALKGMAHLFCELVVRMQARALTDANTFQLPLIQQDLADILGVSIVHVNRQIRQLRERGLVVVNRGHVTVVDWAGLQRLAQFDPGYLHAVWADDMSDLRGFGALPAKG